MVTINPAQRSTIETLMGRLVLADVHMVISLWESVAGAKLRGGPHQALITDSKEDLGA
jgi:hypothetical protein